MSPALLLIRNCRTSHPTTRTNAKSLIVHEPFRFPLSLAISSESFLLHFLFRYQRCRHDNPELQKMLEESERQGGSCMAS